MRLALAISLLSAAGCAAPPGGLGSPVAAERVRAMLAAAEAGDRSAMPAMVAGLDSADPSVRMTAIHCLERLEGTTLGYDHAAPEWERRPAADRWQARLEGPPAPEPRGHDS